MKLISIRKMKKRINVPANVKMGRICAIWLFCIALQAISIPILAQSAKISCRQNALIFLQALWGRGGKRKTNKKHLAHGTEKNQNPFVFVLLF